MRPVARARSDSEGHLVLERVPAGPYVLSVHHPAQATLDLDVTVPAPPLTVELVLGGHLKGRILDRGNPPGRSLFVILLPRGSEAPDQMLPTFTASADTGDFVVIVNAEKVALSGTKRDTKYLYRHSGYPGGLLRRTVGEMLDRHPERLVEKAVQGMLPKNRLGRAMARKLKVYAGPNHPHAAQKPAPFEITQVAQ